MARMLIWMCRNVAPNEKISYTIRVMFRRKQIIYSVLSCGSVALTYIYPLSSIVWRANIGKCVDVRKLFCTRFELCESSFSHKRGQKKRYNIFFPFLVCGAEDGLRCAMYIFHPNWKFDQILSARIRILRGFFRSLRVRVPHSTLAEPP